MHGSPMYPCTSNKCPSQGITMSPGAGNLFPARLDSYLRSQANAEDPRRPLPDHLTRSPFAPLEQSLNLD